MLKQTFVSAVLATAVVGLSAQGQSASAAQGAPTAKPASAPGKTLAGPVKQAVKPTASHAPAATTMLAAEQTALVKQYCAGCHSERGKAGGLSLAAFDATKLEEHGETTEKIIRKLRAGMMPPSGARRPEPAVLSGLAAAFE